MDTRAQVSHKGVHTQICGWHMDFNDPWTPRKAAYTTTSTQHLATTGTRCIDGHQCATYVWTRTARPECAAWGEASGYPGGLSCPPPNTPQLGLLSVSCLLDPSSSCCFAVAFFSSFDPGEKLRTVERGKTARVQPECCGLSFLSLLKRTTLKGEGARWKKCLSLWEALISQLVLSKQLKESTVSCLRCILFLMLPAA